MGEDGGDETAGMKALVGRGGEGKGRRGRREDDIAGMKALVRRGGEGKGREG